MISIALDDSTVLSVECLVPLERLWLVWPSNGLPYSTAVQTVLVDNHSHQFAVLNSVNTALIREILMAGGAERIAEAYNRKP